MRQNYFPGIQVVRAAAAILVLLCHIVWAFSEAFPTPAPLHQYMALYGNIGVDLFFAISGFVIFYNCFHTGIERVAVGRFLLRRALRIFPLYWLAFLCACLMYASGRRAGDNVTVSSMAWDVFLLPQATYDTTVSVSWTLSFEMLFYFLFAVALLTRSRVLTLLGASGGLLIVAILGPAVPALAENDIPIVVEFIYGMVLANIVIVRSRPIEISFYYLVPIVAFTFGAMFLSSQYISFETISPWYRAVFWGLPCAAVVAIAIRLQPRENALFRFAVLLGNASYAIYLFHYFFAYATESLMRRVTLSNAGIFMVEILIISSSIVFGVLVYLAIDRPLQRTLASPLGRQATATS